MSKTESKTIEQEAEEYADTYEEYGQNSIAKYAYIAGTEKRLERIKELEDEIEYLKFENGLLFKKMVSLHKKINVKNE